MATVHNESLPASGQLSKSHTCMVRVWACFGICLFVATWKLWTPQSLFPQIPIFEFLVDIPATIDWIAFATVLSSLILIAAKRSLSNFQTSCLLALFTSGLAVLFSLDQHRFQPWAWHWFVFAVILAIAQRREAMYWLRWIAISVYIYSAISKLDYQFTHTVGMQMLETLAKPVAGSNADWLLEFGPRFVLLLPMAELLVGFGLIFSMTRVASGWLAIILHGSLVFILGPFGLNHYLPVLVWNVYFAIQAYWLFVKSESEDPSERMSSIGSKVVSGFALCVALFPATCSLDGCDHWLAWELYAPRSSRIKIELPETVVQQLPNTVAMYAKKSAALPGVIELDLAQWSLKELSVPVYPQSRFQFGVARWTGERLDNDQTMHVTVKSQSDRWTGSREQRNVQGMLDFKNEASRYWLNTVPRSHDAKKTETNAEIAIAR